MKKMTRFQQGSVESIYLIPLYENCIKAVGIVKESDKKNIAYDLFRLICKDRLLYATENEYKNSPYDLTYKNFTHYKKVQVRNILSKK